MILFWCLIPKGEKVRAKATGSANHLRILKLEELEFGFCQNTLIAKFGLLWGRILIMGKGGVLALNQFYSWNISRFVETSVFDLEIGKRI
jgi:hypothetical protein